MKFFQILLLSAFVMTAIMAIDPNTKNVRSRGSSSRIGGSRKSSSGSASSSRTGQQSGSLGGSAAGTQTQTNLGYQGGSHGVNTGIQNSDGTHYQFSDSLSKSNDGIGQIGDASRHNSAAMSVGAFSYMNAHGHSNINRNRNHQKESSTTSTSTTKKPN